MNYFFVPAVVLLLSFSCVAHLRSISLLSNQSVQVCDATEDQCLFDSQVPKKLL